MACGTTYDVGCDCADRSTASPATTYINNGNPATADGTVEYAYTYCCTSLTGVEYGAFEDNGGNNLTCRGNCSGAGLTATAGQCTTHEAGVDFTAFSVSTGEYAAIYAATG